MKNDKVKDLVNDLLEKNHDAHKGFLKAAEDVTSSRLKMYFKDNADNRRLFIQKLRTEALSYVDADDLKDDGSFTGDLHRTWMDIKSALSTDNEEAILEECIRGDKAAVDEYEDVLEEHADLPAGLRNVITQQKEHIQSTLRNIKSLEDLH